MPFTAEALARYRREVAAIDFAGDLEKDWAALFDVTLRLIILAMRNFEPWSTEETAVRAEAQAELTGLIGDLSHQATLDLVEVPEPSTWLGLPELTRDQIEAPHGKTELAILDPDYYRIFRITARRFFSRLSHQAQPEVEGVVARALRRPTVVETVAETVAEPPVMEPVMELPVMELPVMETGPLLAMATLLPGLPPPPVETAAPPPETITLSPETLRSSAETSTAAERPVKIERSELASEQKERGRLRQAVLDQAWKRKPGVSIRGELAAANIKATTYFDYRSGRTKVPDGRFLDRLSELLGVCVLERNAFL